MPRIFDNINNRLLETLRPTLAGSSRADFCVGYFNLRGWQAIGDIVSEWNAATGQTCRVLVGMQRPPHEDIKALYHLESASAERPLDNATATRMLVKFAEHLKEQITLGIPTGRDEAGLRQLARQLRAGQVVVKLFLPYPLHAKLYLLFRDDINNPITGFVGSSNLTMSGLSKQGELNVDVLEHDATAKLSQWFDMQWGTLSAQPEAQAQGYKAVFENVCVGVVDENFITGIEGGERFPKVETVVGGETVPGAK